MTEEARFTRHGPKNAARYAAHLELFLPRQGERRFSVAPLVVEVSLGEQEFRDDDGFGFCMQFRRIIVEVITRHCEIARKPRYQRTLPREDFTQFLKRAVQKERLAAAGAKASLGSLSKVFASLGMDIGLSGELQASLHSENTQTVEGKVAFKIVRWLSAGRWQIGHQILGDPSELDGCLRGSYFVHAPDDCDVDDENVLCILNPLGERDFFADVEVRAKFDDCIFRSLDENSPSEEWARKNKEAIQKILALKMLREQNRNDGMVAPDGEIILARGRMGIKRLGEV